VSGDKKVLNLQERKNESDQFTFPSIQLPSTKSAQGMEWSCTENIIGQLAGPFSKTGKKENGLREAIWPDEYQGISVATVTGSARNLGLNNGSLNALERCSSRIGDHRDRNHFAQDDVCPVDDLFPHGKAATIRD
jgi:hypothetical protein